MLKKIASESFGLKAAIVLIPWVAFEVLSLSIGEMEFVWNINNYFLSFMYVLLILFFGLTLAGIAYVCYRSFYVELFSDIADKYFSLPYKKSQIIISKTMPIILLLSLVVASSRYYFGYYLPMENVLIAFKSFFLCSASCYLLLFALCYSRSKDLCQIGKVFWVSIIIAVLFNLCIEIITLIISSSYYDNHYVFFSDEYVALASIVFYLVETIVAISLIKKTADNKMCIV